MTRTSRDSPSSRTRLVGRGGGARGGARHRRPRAPRRGGARRAGRDGGPARAAHQRGAGPRPARPRRLAVPGRPGRARGPRSRDRSPRAAAARGRVGAAVAAAPRSCWPGSRSRVALAAAERDPRSSSRARAASRRCRETRERLRDLGRELDELVNSVHKDEMARAELRMRIEQLEERALDELGLDADGLVADYGPDQLVPRHGRGAEGEQVPEPAPYDREEQAKRLRAAERSMAQLGTDQPAGARGVHGARGAAPVPHRAARGPAPHPQGPARHRRGGRRARRAGLHRGVRRREQAFDSIFSRLFPGGEGRLVLTDPAEHADTGIEVEARPPARRSSGCRCCPVASGRWSRCAFLVALFKARPSPFYILDEVEAALDDTNLGRLLEIYEELRENSQLLVITHQKRTMEVADALYGVSMRGDGVSAVISQRLREAGVGVSARPGPPRGRRHPTATEYVVCAQPPRGGRTRTSTATSTTSSTLVLRHRGQRPPRGGHGRRHPCGCRRSEWWRRSAAASSARAGIPGDGRRRRGRREGRHVGRLPAGDLPGRLRRAGRGRGGSCTSTSTTPRATRARGVPSAPSRTRSARSSSRFYETTRLVFDW